MTVRTAVYVAWTNQPMGIAWWSTYWDSICSMRLTTYIKTCIYEVWFAFLFLIVSVNMMIHAVFSLCFYLIDQPGKQNWRQTSENNLFNKGPRTRERPVAVGVP